jgi:hypothetical protein
MKHSELLHRYIVGLSDPAFSVTPFADALLQCLIADTFNIVRYLKLSLSEYKDCNLMSSDVVRLEDNPCSGGKYLCEYGESNLKDGPVSYLHNTMQEH